MPLQNLPLSMNPRIPLPVRVMTALLSTSPAEASTTRRGSIEDLAPDGYRSAKAACAPFSGKPPALRRGLRDPVALVNNTRRSPLHTRSWRAFRCHQCCSCRRAGRRRLRLLAVVASPCSLASDSGARPASWSLPERPPFYLAFDLPSDRPSSNRAASRRPALNRGAPEGRSGFPSSFVQRRRPRPGVPSGFRVGAIEGFSGAIELMGWCHRVSQGVPSDFGRRDPAVPSSFPNRPSLSPCCLVQTNNQRVGQDTHFVMTKRQAARPAGAADQTRADRRKERRQAGSLPTPPGPVPRPTR